MRRFLGHSVFTPPLLLALLSFASLLAPGSHAASKAAPANPTHINARGIRAAKFIRDQDYLGFRMYVQKIYKEPVRRGEWKTVKSLIAAYSEQVGTDLIPFWNARNPGDQDEVDLLLGKADELMLSQQYDQAFTEAQNALLKLKSQLKTRPEVRAFIPFAYHSMGRALYGAKRYDEALKVYQWIGNGYPNLKQVLFEKMWAGFKAGRVEIALGAIASQRSKYFSSARFIHGESYLLQTYLLRRLCREDDLAEVARELKALERTIQTGGIAAWAEMDTGTLSLWRLTREIDENRKRTSSFTKEERASERRKIQEKLASAYEHQKPILLKNIKTIQAFENLASMTDTSTILKPVETLRDRDQLLKMNLEFWPADTSEEWIDEVGKHVLIGDSLCGKKDVK